MQNCLLVLSHVERIWRVCCFSLPSNWPCQSDYGNRATMKGIACVLLTNKHFTVECHWWTTHSTSDSAAHCWGNNCTWSAQRKFLNFFLYSAQCDVLTFTHIHTYILTIHTWHDLTYIADNCIFLRKTNSLYSCFPDSISNSWVKLCTVFVTKYDQHKFLFILSSSQN